MKSGPGKQAGEAGSMTGQGKSKPEAVFQLPAWRGLIPFSQTPRAVVWNTPQDCLPEKWKGECFFTSSVPRWSRVPKRLKSVPRTSVSRQGSPRRGAPPGTPGLSGCHSTAWECEQGMEGFQNTPPLTVSCGPCLSVGIYVC